MKKLIWIGCILILTIVIGFTTNTDTEYVPGAENIASFQI